MEIKPGVERWAVKTGTDQEANQVDIENPQSGTIVELVSLPAPPDPDQISDRDEPTETTAYTLDAILTAYKLERDGDYHLVLDDGNGNTMIVEIPDPDFCAESIWLEQITAARQSFNDKFGDLVHKLREIATLTNGVVMITHVSDPVTVTGVGFFDRKHGQTGVAPNGIELHPVLSINFNEDQA